MKRINGIKNMVVCIDTPPIEIHKYCLVNWLYSGVTLTAQLDGSYTDDQGIHYEFNGKKIFRTKNNLINIHAEVITSKDLMKITAPYPVNIVISAWLTPKGYKLLEKELKEYDLSVFKYSNYYHSVFEDNYYISDNYLNNYIHYKKPVFEIKEYIILDEDKAVIRKWAQNFDQINDTIEHYQHHGLKIHALCIEKLQYFYEILNFNTKTMMKWLLFYKFLLPIKR